MLEEDIKRKVKQCTKPNVSRYGKIPDELKDINTPKTEQREQLKIQYNRLMKREKTSLEDK